jgi:hypothetical protein
VTFCSLIRTGLQVLSERRVEMGLYHNLYKQFVSIWVVVVRSETLEARLPEILTGENDSDAGKPGILLCL